jgi:hypothetical protein
LLELSDLSTKWMGTSPVFKLFLVWRFVNCKMQALPSSLRPSIVTIIWEITPDFRIQLLPPSLTLISHFFL